MKILTMTLILGMSFGLTACSDMPSECAEVWKIMENVAKESGIPNDAIKAQKKQFEEQLSQIPKDEAAKNCKTQLSFLEMMK